MQIENAVPRIGAIVTGIDVRSLADGDWSSSIRLGSTVMC